MVSFVCNHCQETLKKPKLDIHLERCRFGSFSCIDCSKDFQGTDYRLHTQCVSEAEKYQKRLYKPKNSAKSTTSIHPIPPLYVKPHLKESSNSSANTIQPACDSKVLNRVDNSDPTVYFKSLGIKRKWFVKEIVPLRKSLKRIAKRLLMKVSVGATRPDNLIDVA